MRHLPQTQLLQHRKFRRRDCHDQTMSLSLNDEACRACISFRWRAVVLHDFAKEFLELRLGLGEQLLALLRCSVVPPALAGDDLFADGQVGLDRGSRGPVCSRAGRVPRSSPRRKLAPGPRDAGCGRAQSRQKNVSAACRLPSEKNLGIERRYQTRHYLSRRRGARTVMTVVLDRAFCRMISAPQGRTVVD